MKKIRIYGDDILREKACEVKNIDRNVHRLVKDMKGMLQKAEGLGLAATQVGSIHRIFIAADRERGRIITAVNPELLIIDERSEEIDLEGCLSFPDIYFSIPRARRTVLRARDENGKDIVIEAKGILSRCFQHELDHLNGRLIIDYASPEEKRILKEKIDKILNTAS